MRRLRQIQGPDVWYPGKMVGRQRKWRGSGRGLIWEVSPTQRPECVAQDRFLLRRVTNHRFEILARAEDILTHFRSIP